MHKISRILGISIAASLMLTAELAWAQPSDEIDALQLEVQAIRQEQEQIQKELAEIKTLLQSRPRAGG